MLDCEGPAAGRGHDYKEKYVAMKPLSPSKDFKKEDIKEYKVSEPSTLHLAGPSVVYCGSSAQHNRRFSPRDGADVGGGETNRSQFSAWTNSGRDSPHQHPVSARRRLTGKDKFNSDVNLYIHVLVFRFQFT